MRGEVNAIRAATRIAPRARGAAVMLLALRVGAHPPQQTRQLPHEAQQLQLQLTPIQPTPQPLHPAHRATPHRATAHRATPHRATAQRAPPHLATAHLPPQRPQARASCISSLIDMRFSWSNTKKVARLTSDISSSPSVISWPGK